MPAGTLDVMKLPGDPPTYQIMFEENAGGTFVHRVDADELAPFLHEELRINQATAVQAANKAQQDGRIRIPEVVLEENNLHASMDYMEAEDLGTE